MKNKLLLFLLLASLPLSAFYLKADESEHRQKIPLYNTHNGNQDHDIRTLIQLPVECCYLGMMNTLVTTVYSDLGDVTITVTNCSTGDVWYDSFDSALEPQTMLTLSGDPGVYEIVYITESGDIYDGTFNLN